jgi:hypothetical protein
MGLVGANGWGQLVSARDQRYLELHHGSWRVVVGYRHGGRVIKLRRSLHTASLREAQRLRWPVVAELKTGMVSEADEADAWKAALAASTGEPYDPVDAALSDRLDAIERQHGSARAEEFAARATGRATPIDTHVDAFLTSRGELRADTKARHEAAIGGLVGWLKRRGLSPTIQAVDRRLAIQYADELSPGRPDPKRLSLYWQWLVRREHAQMDPWHGLSARPRTRSGEPERPFEDDEVRRLMVGPAPLPYET